MPRRVLGAALTAAWVLSGAASAQIARESAAPPGITFTRPADPPPHTPPSPHPPGRDNHQQARAARAPGGDLFLAGPETYAPRYDRRGHAKRPFLPPYGYVAAGYSGVGFPTGSPRRAPHGAPAGFLRLRVQPLPADVYVDGFLIGTVEDFRGSDYGLEPGTHRLEVRADGFEHRAVDIRIRPGETLTYRGELERIVPPAVEMPPPVASAPPVSSRSARTIYVIPRCYAGNRRPRETDLPSGCSLSALRVVAP